MKIRQSTRSNPLSLSPTFYSNAGMTHTLGSPYWRDLFDIVIVQAMKPSFYSNSDRPFRLLNPRSMSQTWRPVSSLERGQIYIQGNVGDFISMTGLPGARVLYFGDHVFSDLAVRLQAQWNSIYQLFGLL
jgi:hypothetical protein